MEYSVAYLFVGRFLKEAIDPDRLLSIGLWSEALDSCFWIFCNFGMLIGMFKALLVESTF